MTTADLLRAQGRAEGRTQGRAELLLRQLSVKFGPVDESVRARISTATDAQLDTWAERILTAPTIAEILN